MIDHTVAETILQQLGGNHFIAMTGAKGFITNGNDLAFSIGKNASKVNRVQIILDAEDTYTVKFIKFTPDRLNHKTYEFKPAKFEVLEEHNGIYFDMLQPLFTQVTKMYTHL